MAVNLNRRRGPKKTKIPLGNIARIKDTNSKNATESKEVASVIVTICAKDSYDTLFRKLPQESEYGKVCVYLLKPGQMLGFVHRTLNNDVVDKFEDSSGTALAPKTKRILKQLKKDCDEAGPDAVCINFECCGGYSKAGFCEGGDLKYKEMYLDFITFLATDYGCMTMFADFSLMALISDWDEKRLGPNPFKQVQVFGGDIELSFDAEVLKKSPSAQLNTIANLSETGNAKLHAMAGTIAFTITEEARQIAIETEQSRKDQENVDPIDRKYIAPFEVEVLTVATLLCNRAFTDNKLKEIEEEGEDVICEVNEKKGLAGHVLLTFPPSDRNMEKYKADLVEEEEARAKAIEENNILEGEDDDGKADITPVRGMFLVSAGHWIELMKIDVNMDRLLNTVKEEWGEEAENFQQMRGRYGNMTVAEQTLNANTDAVTYMQSRAPAKFNRKLVRKKKKGF